MSKLAFCWLMWRDTFCYDMSKSRHILAFNESTNDLERPAFVVCVQQRALDWNNEN